MTSRASSRLAWWLFAAAVALVCAGIWLAALIDIDLRASEAWFLGGQLLIALTYTGMGALLMSRVPRNAIGWLLFAIGLFQALEVLSGAYGTYALDVRHGGLAGGDIAIWLSGWSWMPSVGLLVTFLLLLFPDGRLPSPRWRWVARAAATGLILAVVGSMIAIWPGRRLLANGGDVQHALRGPFLPVILIGFAISMSAAIASIASLVVRFRRSPGTERQQLRWFTLAGLVTIVGLLISFSPLPNQLLFLVGFLSLPIAAAIAILKYRLYELDIVINKTVVYGALAVFITAVYVAIVVGIGSLVGRGDRPNVGLSILATAIVAVAFQPVRQRMQRLANRLVYGERATPYEVLTRFSERVAGTYATEDVLPRTARVIAEGTGAARADVWLRFGSELRPAASWPDVDGSLEATALSGDALPRLEGTDRAIPVRHQGELLGAVTVTNPTGDPLTPAEDKLLVDLASQAGLVLRNVALATELQARLDVLTRQAAELRTSRQRIVAAQDAERRRLERNIHDGAQQQLVALAVKLRLARSVANSDPPQAKQILLALQEETDEALETLTDLSRGIYPPVLEDEGIAAALEAQVHRTGFPIRIDAEGVRRHSIEVEAAVYFCCLEALQNATKHAGATAINVRIEEGVGDLRFEVTDDGVGFDAASTPRGTGLQSMADRLEALGGSIEVRSETGCGTTASGAIPVRAKEPIQ